MHRAKRAARHEPITERLILRVVNEAVACLREGVVTDLDSIDAGLVYGTGFAPYLGGPMRYTETLGEAATAPSLARGPRLDPIGDVGICSTLRRLAQEYGTRFEPGAGWTRREIFTHQLLPKV